jgi:hypothetical protein
VRSRLLKRIQLLEQRLELARPVLIQYSWLKRLPKEYVGERHVVIVKRTTTGPGFEWCRSEERPGAAPPDLDDSSLTVCLTKRAAEAQRKP